MISLRYYLDTRTPSRRPDGRHPLKLAVTKHGDTALLPVMAYATREEWDARGQRLKGGRLGDAGKVNSYLARMMLRFEDCLRELVERDAAGPALTARQVRDYLRERCFDAGTGLTLGEYYQRILEEKHGSTRTGFERARTSFEKAVPRLMDLPLAAVSTREVERVDAWLRAHLAPNTRNTYIAKLTQVLKRAHREGLNAADAGRDIRLRVEESKSRALTAAQLRLLLDAEPDTDLGREALDFFRLSFYLRAINPVDLMRVTPDDVFNGRLMYERSKTGKAYSVRVEPEAQAVMDRRSDGWRIWAPGRGRELRNYQQDLNDALRRIAKGLSLPPVTMYWARHTFASLMIESGAPIEVVAAALGHSYGPRVTMGYVTIREKAVDDAVRALLDYLAENANK